MRVNWRRLWVCVALMLLVPSAAAQTLVLISGFLGDSEGWRDSGVTWLLAEQGWWEGGELKMTPVGVMPTAPPTRSARRFFTLDMPNTGPLFVQAAFLGKYLEFIHARYPGEPIILVGHSAGGVVARLYMVLQPRSGVSALITIASPHLGSELAQLGTLMGNSPMAWFAPFMGASKFNRAQALFQDLAPARPYNLLGWLNLQPHPPALYVSIVRGRDASWLGMGDLLVPAYSQDLNNVPALRGMARTLPTGGSHEVQFEDGILLVRMLTLLNLIQRG